MRIWLSGTIAIALSFVVTSCTSQNGAMQSQTPMPSNSVTTNEPNANSGPWTVYYVGDTPAGPKLYAETSDLGIEGSADESDAAVTALNYLVRQGSKPNDADYTNLWGNGTTINSVTYAGEKAVIDLTLAPLNVGSSFEMAAIDQLVWTVTENRSGIGSVQFMSNGKPIESFAGHVDTSQTFSRAPNYEVLAPVWVDNPSQVLVNPVAITGTACTFEASFGWEVKLGDKVVQSGPGTAAVACPERSPWTVELGELKPGTYTFIATDYSAEDGSVNQQDSKEFTVQ